MEKTALNYIIEREVEKLTALTNNYLVEDTRVDKMELGLLKQLLSMCYTILDFILQQKIKQKQEKRPIVKTTERIENKGIQPRKYQSLFGLHELLRSSYWTKTTGTLYCLLYTSPSPRDRG